MEKTGILILMHAKPGKELQLERILHGTELLAEQELSTAAYYVFKLDPSRFGIFVTSKDDEARQAQRRSQLAHVLLASTKELCDPIPIGDNLELLIAKPPEVMRTRREHPLPGWRLSHAQIEGLAKSLMRS